MQIWNPERKTFQLILKFFKKLKTYFQPWQSFFNKSWELTRLAGLHIVSTTSVSCCVSLKKLFFDLHKLKSYTFLKHVLHYHPNPNAFTTLTTKLWEKQTHKKIYRLDARDKGLENMIKSYPNKRLLNDSGN